MRYRGRLVLNNEWATGMSLCFPTQDKLLLRVCWKYATLEFKKTTKIEVQFIWPSLNQKMLGNKNLESLLQCLT